MNVTERFLKYVSFWTTSEEYTEKTPSTDRQLDLGNYLLNELKELGIQDAYMDEYGYVYGSIPATPGYESCPSVGFMAHMDTSPECSGRNVKPQIIEDYDGQEILLGNGEKKLTLEEFPHLAAWKGRTIITTDGTTLLGADDKAGIAEIMAAAQEIIEEDKPHGKICLGFTVDEEIGNGADTFDLERFGAQYGFTVDGSIEGEIEFENFNAATAIVTASGKNIHPGSAKDIMVNSQHIIMEVHSMLPEMEKPEHTEGYEGFYHLIEMNGCVQGSRLVYIIRDFDMDKFNQKKEYLRTICQKMNEKYGNRVEVEITDSYFNMREQIEPCMWMIDFAKEACKKAGVESKVIPIRGGTDGARLSFRGLPCPNLGTGGTAFHGEYEHISVEGMEKTVEIIKNLVDAFAGKND